MRSLISLAIRLRELASDMIPEANQTLYLLTASALEKHSEKLAAESDGNRVPPDDLRFYRPVDMTV